MSSAVAFVPLTSSPSEKWKLWIGRALSGLVAGMMLLSASMKLIGSPQVMDMFTNKFGYTAATIGVIAGLEIASVVLYLIPRTAVLGAIIVTGYLGGAVATHVRVSDNFLAPLALGIFAWVGLYLRDERLSALVPLRRIGSRR